jgi:hypothetical protein
MLIKSTNIPKILFIKGIFKKDCLSDDIFEKKILENTLPETECINSNEVIINGTSFINYEKLPNIFSNIETWQKKSNLSCWNCTLQFTSIPVFIPKVIEPITIKNKIERENSDEQKFSISVEGVFCSFGCTRQFIETRNYSISDRTETLNKLRLLHKLFYNNNKMRELTYYPTPLIMKRFGGELTEIEFKEELNKYNFTDFT